MNLFLFSIKIALLFSSQTTFLFVVMPQYLTSIGIDIYKISYLFGATKLIKILSTVPFGILFDKHPRSTFFISILFKLIGVCFLFFAKTYGENLVALATLFIGLSQGSIFIKTDVFVYNFLKNAKKIDLFPKYISLYYMIANIIYAIVIFSAGIFLKKSGFGLIFILTILMLFSSTVSLYLTPKYKIEKRKKLKLKNLYELIFQKKKELKILIALSILNAYVWQIPKLTTIILAKSHIMNTTYILSIIQGGITIGCLIPMVKIIKDIKNVFLITATLFLSIIIGSMVNNYLYFAIFSIFILNLLYTLINVSIEREIDSKINQEERGAFLSISVIIMTGIQMLSFFFFGKLLENNINPTTSLGIILIPAFLTFLYQFKSKTCKL